MLSRRRIDWSEIVGPNAAIPVWHEAPARSEAVGLLLAMEDLFALQDPDALLRRAVDLALTEVGLVRAGAYLHDTSLDLMVGTWGTDLRRNVVDEHHVMFRLNGPGRRVLQRALSGEAHWTMVEDCPIIVNDAHETRVLGQGWVVCTPIRSAGAALGMLYNDAGMTGAAVDPAKQARAAILCAVVGMLLQRIRAARGPSSSTGLTTRHPAVAKAVQMLADDPSLSAAAIAAQLDVGASRFARVFKGQMGTSLVDYRNQLRLERFDRQVEEGNTNLLGAAMAAGFGSYAQFHRVFHAVRGMPPRDYLRNR
jgi:AraC-like DNA-binding protein